MDTSLFSEAVQHPGPMATIHLDATRGDASVKHELELRWAALRASLLEDGAPAELVEQAQELALAVTGIAGPHGRTLVIAESGVLLDHILPEPPARDSAHFGTVPHLLPTARALGASVPHFLVRADHRGAEITVSTVDPAGGGAVEVDGGHDVLHKFGGGGWSHRRFQMRVEDSWERNAEAVARELDAMVQQHAPALIVLAGDPHSKGYLRRHLGARTGDLVVEIDGPGRADGANEEALEESVEAALTQFRMTRMGEVLARFEEQTGKGGGANGLDAVVDALRGGAVDTLLLNDDPTSTLRLWAGPEPLQLGTQKADVLALGAQQALEDRADAVLLRALVAQGGALELVSGESVVRDGIGAILRFDTRPPTPGG
jgi:hypothetical protein